MARVNWGQFAKSLADPLRDLGKKHAAELGDAYKDYEERVAHIEDDAQRTLLALETASEDWRIRVLQEDLKRFLPARRAAVESILVSRVSSEAKAAFDAALEVTIKAVVIAAKAFI